MVWFKEDDMFEPKAVEEARKERERNESERRPDGSEGMRCWCCGRIQSAYAIAGNCCYFCHQTL